MSFTVSETYVGNTNITFPQSGTLATVDQVILPNNVTGTSSSLAPGNLYVVNNASLVTLTLPVMANVGDRILIRGSGAGGWVIEQNSSQIIHVGNGSSTAGVAGSVSSSNRYDCVELTCIVANTEFVCSGIQGNLVLV